MYNSAADPVPASGINDGDNDTEVEVKLLSVNMPMDFRTYL
jgi:hypothetical protein